MHIKRLSRNSAAVLAITAAAFAATTSIAAAKTVKFKVDCTSKLISQGSGGGKSKDTCKSKALGKVTGTSTLAPPSFKQVLKVKGGTLVLKGTTKIGSDGKQHVSGKVTGTGKYKKAKGKFTGVGGINKKKQITASAQGTFSN